MNNLDGGGRFEVKNFIYTYSLFKGNLSIESKITEYGIILLHKYKVEQTEVISKFIFTFLLTNSKNIYIFLINFPILFTVTTSEVYLITFWKYTKHPIKVLLKISTCSFKNMETCNLFIKLLLYNAFMIKLL